MSENKKDLLLDEELETEFDELEEQVDEVEIIEKKSMIDSRCK